MSPSRSKDPLVFSSYTIRLMIGAIALLFPVVVLLSAPGITPSLSWSYYTGARDLFVGLLFVIGAFLVSYQGHKQTLQKKAAGKFRKWVGENQETFVAMVGGVAAGAAAVAPTAKCFTADCLVPTAILHYVGATILFAATAYFCLVAFVGRVRAKLAADEGSRASKKTAKALLAPKRLRIGVYLFCGWGIVLIMLASIVAAITRFYPISNFTFWMETVSLELFGFAWLTASHYLPILTDESERKKTPLEQAIRQSK